MGVNLDAVVRVLGLLLAATAIAMLVPFFVSLLAGEDAAPWFALCIGIGLALGAPTALLLRGRQDLRKRDGFVIVSVGWLVVGLFGAMPFWLSGQIPSFTDAAFESVSGFTTTGASILSDIEQRVVTDPDTGEAVTVGLQRGPLLWRSMIQWLGGMGIVVLSLAILPLLGVGGMQLFRAEAPGPSPDRLTPRIKETARLLWGVYCALSLSCMVALMIAGLGWYDALCHAFTTMATGGFSTQDTSIGGFANPAVESVLIVFMFLAGVNFSLHYAAIRGRLGAYLGDSEFKTYLSVVAVAGAAIGLSNLGATEMGVVENVRTTLFQVVSIVTTTGFGTADYELWSSMSQFVLLALMFIGGCAGSTGGGMKNVRLLLLTRHAVNELRKLLHPRGVYVIRFNHRAVPGDVVTNILGFFLLLMIVTVAATFAMTLLGLDLLSAFGSVAATLNNIGPGIGSVGPTDDFGHLPDVGKWLLVFLMLLGRLELYTVLVLLVPDFWRRT